MSDWADIQANIQGVKLIRHAVITFNGTWGSGLVQYPGDVVNGLAQYVDDALCEEVPCPYPASFGFVGGAADSPSYEQSIQDAVSWTADWLGANPNRTFGLGGYSQGGEAASRVLIELQSGSLTQYMPNFVGGYTFGNPCRRADSVAPGIGNPGAQWRGISSVNLTNLPTVNGQTVWADYVHSKANGDAGNDMYTMVPTGQVGTIMTDFYTTATQAQINNPTVFLQNMVTDMLKVVQDSGLLSSVKGGMSGLLAMGFGAATTFLLGLIGGGNPNATGVNADAEAAALGLQFLASAGGPTGPHISYGGEIPGYSNLLAPAVVFLNRIATLTPARV